LPPEIKATTQEILRALLSNVGKIPKNKLGMLLNVVRMYTEAPPPAPNVADRHINSFPLRASDKLALFCAYYFDFALPLRFFCLS
jgi:hypothetical protein